MKLLHTFLRQSFIGMDQNTYHWLLTCSDWSSICNLLDLIRIIILKNTKKKNQKTNLHRNFLVFLFWEVGTWILDREWRCYFKVKMNEFDPNQCPLADSRHWSKRRIRHGHGLSSVPTNIVGVRVWINFNYLILSSKNISNVLRMFYVFFLDS